jgi:hypothetical protein
MISSGVGVLEEAIHARWSASWLSNRGTYRTSNPSKNFSILRTFARYSVIFSLLQLYSFCTCFTASYESPMIRSHWMPRYLASQNLMTSLSYSAMLFVVGNSSWIAYLRISHSGGWARHLNLLLLECMIHRNTSPSDRLAHQFLVGLNQSSQWWNSWVLETWLPVRWWIQYHIGRFPLPTLWSALLLICFGGRAPVTDRIWLIHNESGNNVWASWSSWELHRATSALVGILFKCFSRFHW